MSRKRAFDVFRILICAVALWLVVRGVTFHDRVHLVDGKVHAGRLVGEGEGEDDIVVLAERSGQTVEIPAAGIALDDDGARRITIGLRTALSRSNKSLFLLAILIHMPVVFLQAVRLKWMLAAQSIAMSYGECLKLSWAGNFLNFATPLGSNAGDVFKAYFVSLHTERKTEGITTVVLDRIVGLASLLLVTAAIVLFTVGKGPIAELRPLILGFVIAGVVSVVLYLSPVVRRYLFPRKWLSRLPFFDHMQRVDSTARTFATHPWAVTGCLLITVLLQAIALGAYFTVAMALGLNAAFSNLFEFYSYFYLGCLIQALPGPPQGLGTVELAYRYFFSPYGTVSQIICMAFVIRLVVLICALPGLLVTVTGSYRPSDRKGWQEDFTTSELSIASGPAREEVR